MASGTRRSDAAPSGRHTGSTPPIDTPQPGSATEQTVARLHPSARRLVVPSIASIAVSGAAVYSAASASDTLHRLAFAGGGLIAILGIGVIPFLLWASRVYLITTRRIVARKGVFTRERRELPHSRANLLELRQSALQRMAGTGDLVILQGEREVFRLLDLPGAGLVEEALRDLMEHSSGSTYARTRQPEATRRAFDPPAR